MNNKYMETFLKVIIGLVAVWVVFGYIGGVIWLADYVTYKLLHTELATFVPFMIIITGIGLPIIIYNALK